MTPGTWYEGLGLMSGSSLDGLDLAWCRFRIDPEAAEPIAAWECLATETLPFPEEWVVRLRELPDSSARALARAHADFGVFLAEACRDFMSRHHCRPGFIASHGHTLFHWPGQGVSFQLGSGAPIASVTGVPAVCDFRTSDIALGGQGAPFAPLADRYLFPGYDYYLNIGGIANISFQSQGRWVAFDVGPANQVFNNLALEVGHPYDENGRLAAGGKLDASLLNSLQALPYYAVSPPKSLDNGWIREVVWPLFVESGAALEDRMYTAVEHLALQTARAIQTWGGHRSGRARMLVSGGGAYNSHLLSRLACHLEAEHSSVELVVPEPEVIEFKEALLIALMGALRLAGLSNCLAEVTGASRNAVGGSVYW